MSVIKEPEDLAVCGICHRFYSLGVCACKIIDKSFYKSSITRTNTACCETIGLGGNKMGGCAIKPHLLKILQKKYDLDRLRFRKNGIYY